MSSERVYAVCNDGVRIALHVFHPRGMSKGTVVLQHGLAANRHVFTQPDRSLAREIADRGYRCIVNELRGTGDSDRPKSWSLDDYIDRDIPALLATTGEPVRWIGHSMGGILMWAYAARHGTAQIDRAVTIASALTYRDSAFRYFLPLRKIIERMPSIPVGSFVRAVSPLVGRVPLPVLTFNVQPSNIEAWVVRRHFRQGMENVSPQLLADLATTFDGQGLRGSDGIPFHSAAARFDKPLLLVSGTRDVQCPPAAVRATHEMFAGAELFELGRAHGSADEYGHFDLIMGTRAREEVWPRVLSFALRPA